MKIIISNDIKIKNPSNAIIDYCKNKLTIDNPDFIIAQKVGRYTGNMAKKMKLYVQNGDTYVLPFGSLSDIWPLVKMYNYELKFHEFKGNLLQGRINLYNYINKK